MADCKGKMKCRECHGKGILNRRECRACHGNGEVTKPETDVVVTITGNSWSSWYSEGETGILMNTKTVGGKWQIKVVLDADGALITSPSTKWIPESDFIMVAYGKR